MNMTKLDAYDYLVLPGVIRIRLEDTRDPDIVDIMSEINRSNGKIYLEGNYYSYLDYRLYSEGDEAFMELYVASV